MTEKRFTIGMLKNYVDDNEINYCYVLELPSDARHLCNLLNELDEKYVDELSLRETLQQELQRIEEENKQLKQQCKDFIEMLDDMSVAYLINDGLEEILND